MMQVQAGAYSKKYQDFAKQQLQHLRSHYDSTSCSSRLKEKELSKETKRRQKNLEEKKRKLLDAEDKRRKAILDNRRKERAKAQVAIKQSVNSLKQRTSSATPQLSSSGSANNAQGKIGGRPNGLNKKPSLSYVPSSAAKDQLSMNKLVELVSGDQPVALPSLDDMLEQLRASGTTPHPTGGHTPHPTGHTLHPTGGHAPHPTSNPSLYPTSGRTPNSTSNPSPHSGIQDEPSQQVNSTKEQTTKGTPISPQDGPGAPQDGPGAPQDGPGAPQSGTNHPVPTVYSTTNFYRKPINKDASGGPASTNMSGLGGAKLQLDSWADRVSDLPLYDSLDSSPSSPSPSPSPSTSTLHLSEPVLDISREFDKAATGFNRSTSEYSLIPKSLSTSSPSSSDGAKQLTSILKKSGQKAQLKQLLNDAIEARSHSSQHLLFTSLGQRTSQGSTGGDTQKRVRFAEEPTNEASSKDIKTSPPPPVAEKNHFMFPPSSEVPLRVAPVETGLPATSAENQQMKKKPLLAHNSSKRRPDSSDSHSKESSTSRPGVCFVPGGEERVGRMPSTVTEPLSQEPYTQEMDPVLNSSSTNSSVPSSPLQAVLNSSDSFIEDKTTPGEEMMGFSKGEVANQLEKTPTDADIAQLWGQMRLYMEENRALQESRRAGLRRLQGQPNVHKNARTHPSDTRTHPSDPKKDLRARPSGSHVVHGTRPPSGGRRRKHHTDKRPQLDNPNHTHQPYSSGHALRLEGSAPSQSRGHIRLWRSSQGWRDKCKVMKAAQDRTMATNKMSAGQMHVDKWENFQMHQSTARSTGEDDLSLSQEEQRLKESIERLNIHLKRNLILNDGTVQKDMTRKTKGVSSRMGYAKRERKDSRKTAATTAPVSSAVQKNQSLIGLPKTRVRRNPQMVAIAADQHAHAVNSRTEFYASHYNRLL